MRTKTSSDSGRRKKRVVIINAGKPAKLSDKIPAIANSELPLKGEICSQASPFSGQHNMAVDEWLLERAITQPALAFRFYLWEQPTLSLGYFQEKSGIELPEKFALLPRVRRLTGGGAILHDQELTYSLVIPPEHPLSSTPVDLYSLIHQLFIDGLAEQGITSQMRGEEQAEKNSSFLCFFRGDRHDVLIDQQKILGSAQRRRKGAILQHGSLILAASPLAEELAGIKELTGIEVDTERLIRFISGHADQLATDWTTTNWQQPQELAEIEILEQRY